MSSYKLSEIIEFKSRNRVDYDAIANKIDRLVTERYPDLSPSEYAATSAFWYLDAKELIQKLVKKYTVPVLYEAMKGE
jgi:hypothetical protein